MTVNGWIKLHKTISEHWVWDDPISLKAWLDLLMSVNYKDKKAMVGGSLITIETGQILTSTLKLSERWGCTWRKTDALLKAFENDQMITVKKCKNGKLVTVLNYKLYQGFSEDDCTTESTTESRTESTTESRTESTQHKNIKNIKEAKEKKHIGEPVRYFPNDDDLEETFHEFITMRNKIKKPMTDKAIDLMIRKLDRMSKDPKEQVKLLEQSITHCWQDVYPLKDESKASTRPKNQYNSFPQREYTDDAIAELERKKREKMLGEMK